MDVNLENIFPLIQEYALKYLPGIAAAILVIIVGLWLVKKIVKLLEHVLGNAKIGPELTGFFASMASLALKFVVVLFAASFVGFEVSTVLGVLAGVVFAVGLYITAQPFSG